TRMVSSPMALFMSVGLSFVRPPGADSCSCPFLTRRVRFMLEACEFLRVGNDTNRLNTLCLHLNAEDEQGLTTSADDDSRLTVDFRYFHLIVLWQKAHRPQAKACHRITPTNGMQLRPAERAATGRFTLVQHRGDLGKLIREDFAQQ